MQKSTLLLNVYSEDKFTPSITIEVINNITKKMIKLILKFCNYFGSFFMSIACFNSVMVEFDYMLDTSDETDSEFP